MSVALPTVFISHGSPMHAIQAGRAGEAWRALGLRLPRPSAVLVASAHWETELPMVGTATRPDYTAVSGNLTFASALTISLEHEGGRVPDFSKASYAERMELEGLRAFVSNAHELPGFVGQFRVILEIAFNTVAQVGRIHNVYDLFLAVLEYINTRKSRQRFQGRC